MHKNASISLTIRDRAISLKVSTHRVLKQYILPNFQKKFFLKRQPFWIYWFSPKMRKSKIACIALPVQGRAILSKFFDPHQSNIPCPIFNNFSCFWKWLPFWIFEFPPKMHKHKNAFISLTVWDREISLKFFTHGLIVRHNTQFFLSKNGGHFDFSNLAVWLTTLFFG